MHNAPPVVYPVGRFVWGARFALALAATVSVALLLWLVWTQASASVCVGVVCAGVAAALATAWWLPREFAQEGELVWDGEAWYAPGAESGAGVVDVSLTLDAGDFMLLAWRCTESAGRGTGVQHAWVRRADMPSRWHGFRCAVYSRRQAVARLA